MILHLHHLPPKKKPGHQRFRAVPKVLIQHLAEGVGDLQRTKAEHLRMKRDEAPSHLTGAKRRKWMGMGDVIDNYGLDQQPSFPI